MGLRPQAGGETPSTLETILNLETVLNLIAPGYLSLHPKQDLWKTDSALLISFTYSDPASNLNGVQGFHRCTPSKAWWL
ncbi:hypothetical protein [Leptothermofonsia sp. ETS-13]|uniref:hypothetical protein n=1 Tax=Leptothermofonsia sp. ETS-13 TaxID=3035696 RepID=UPI003BA33FC2